MTTLGEYRARLAAEPLTLNQLGTVHKEFVRLGWPLADRAGRLALSAILAEYPGKLASTKDLTMGEAGRLIGALRSCRSRADLPALADPPAAPVALPWRELIAAIAEALRGYGLR